MSETQHRQSVHNEQKSDNASESSENAIIVLSNLSTPRRTQISRADQRAPHNRTSSQPLRICFQKLKAASENWLSPSLLPRAGSAVEPNMKGNWSRNGSLTDLSITQISSPYERASEREEELTHALSRTRMQLEEKQEMFQQAVDFGERVQHELEEVNRELTNQLDKNSTLEGEMKILKEKISILENTVREVRQAGVEAHRAFVEADRTTVLVKAELDQQKELSSIIQDDFVTAKKNENERNFDTSETITRLQSELTSEKYRSLEADEAVASLRTELVDSTKRIKELNSKVSSLEEKLVQKENTYSEMFMELSAEKARLESSYNTLMEEFWEKDARFLEAKERLETAGLSVKVQERVFSPSICEIPDLETMLISPATAHTMYDGSEKDWCHRSRTSLSLDSGRNSDQGSLLSRRSRPEKKEPPRIADVVREYLHLTATAVLLHFPDVNTVPSDVLIKKAEDENFSCYYDVMMQHMRSVREEKLRMEVVTDERPDSSSWLSRFFRLKDRREAGNPRAEKPNNQYSEHEKSPCILTLKDSSSRSSFRKSRL